MFCFELRNVAICYIRAKYLHYISRYSIVAIVITHAVDIYSISSCDSEEKISSILNKYFLVLIMVCKRLTHYCVVKILTCYRHHNVNILKKYMIRIDGCKYPTFHKNHPSINGLNKFIVLTTGQGFVELLNLFLSWCTK